MPSDRSRRIDPPASHYLLPVAQQGRVVLDRDFNAWGSYLNARTEADALDFVGTCGTPDNGFAIGAPSTSPPGGFWSPPAPESPPSGEGTGRDFLISGGTMYVGGLRVFWPTTQNGQSVSYSYAGQPELAPPLIGPIDYILTRPAQELVYLDVTLQEVGAAEDPDLLDAALGGPDTTQRLKQRVRVERLKVSATACADAWTQAIAYWQTQGLDFNPATMRLTPAVRLQVGFTQDTTQAGPCDPVAAGGFLGPDNQLIRVRVAGDTLLWSYDNASFLYRVQVAADRKTLTLIGGPPDSHHYPQTNQVVEILVTGAVIDSVPDELSGGSIVRASAQPAGQLFTLTQPYGPAAQGAAGNVLVLPTALSPALLASGLPLFLRVWQAQVDIAFDTPITLQDGNGISTGVTVTLSGAQVAADGAFWQIAVRPATPQGVYPEELLLAPQPADGPFRVVCPLAVLDWTAASPPAIADCRAIFDNLVELTRRKPGCCTVNVAPGDIGKGTTLQSLIDAAAGKAQAVKICLAPGDYALAAPLVLTGLHDFICIECCNGFAALTVAADATADFSGGLLVVNGASGVTLRGLSLIPNAVPMPAAQMTALLSRLSGEAAQTQVTNALRSPSLCIGLHAWNANALTLEGCDVTLLNREGGETIDLIAAALLLQGDCSGLRVTGCHFLSAIPPTFNTLQVSNDYAAAVAQIVPAERMNYFEPLTQAASASVSGSVATETSLTAGPSLAASLTAGGAAETLAAHATAVSGAPHITLNVAPSLVPGQAAESLATGPSLVAEAAHATVAPAVSLAQHPPLETAPAGAQALSLAPMAALTGTLQSPAPDLAASLAATHITLDAAPSIAPALSLAPAPSLSGTATAETQSSTTAPVQDQQQVKTGNLTPMPGVLNAAQEVFSGAALAKLAASRNLASFAALQRPMVASCGILAMTHGAPRREETARGAAFASQLTTCLLDGASITGTSLSGFTFGAFLVADAETLRLADNEVSGGVAGIWAAPSGSTSPDYLMPGTDDYYGTIGDFEEFQALFAVGAILPPPAQTVTRAAINQPSSRDPGGAWFVSGNRIRTGIQVRVNTDQTELTAGLTGLLLWLDGAMQSSTASVDSNLSVLITGNHVRTIAPRAPSVLLVLDYTQPCTLTGNLIANVPILQEIAKPAVWAAIGTPQAPDAAGANIAINTYTAEFAAAGNVLRGTSNLGSINRGNTAARRNWSPYNADPS